MIRHRRKKNPGGVINGIRYFYDFQYEKPVSLMINEPILYVILKDLSKKLKRPKENFFDVLKEYQSQFYGISTFDAFSDPVSSYNDKHMLSNDNYGLIKYIRGT